MSDKFELLVLDSKDQRNVVAYARHRSDTAVGSIAFRDIERLQSFRKRLSDACDGRGNRPSTDELRAFGSELFELIFKDRIRTIYDRLPQSRIRIQIFSDQPEFQALPWEYVQEPKHVLAPNAFRSVVRIVPTIGVEPPKPRSLGGKIRILFLFADPIDQGPVRWEEIRESIEREFNSASNGSFEIKVIEAADRKTLVRELVSEESYDILHFNGHGEISYDPKGRATGNLVLMDQRTKRSDLMPSEELAGIIKGAGLQLVILSACNSATGDFAKPYAVIAEALVSQGVPAVVANQFAINNASAATFAGGFYPSLLKTGDVDHAVNDARKFLFAEHPAGQISIEWGIPVLYRHVDAAQLFEP